jgi:2-C-methyl-D-erythritol 4-phosphate cytidylyltransferase
MNIAIILSGGVGTRVGAEVPKQYIKIMSKPIMVYTLEKFENNPNIDAIELVCIKGDVPSVESIVKEYNITKVRWYTEGGSTFQESTMNGIFNLKDKVAYDDIVLIQFAVSPMITDEIIDDSIAVCSKYGNAVAADEMIMCTCIKDNEYSSSQSILRETLVGLNAPWTFKYDLVCGAYEEAIEKNILNSLEPHTTSLMFALGKKIYFSKSATSNIKITRKEDLDLFEGYLLLQKSRSLL